MAETTEGFVIGALAPVVSVVIPTHGRPHLLGDCLRSLVRQDLEQPYELVVVDDGGMDEIQRVVEEASAGADTVKVEYVRQPKLGPNAARNRGASAAAADLICFVDDDIEAPPGWLTALVDASANYPEVEAIGGPILLRIEGREPRHCPRDRLPETHLDRGPGLVWDEKLWSANLACRRSAFARVGELDETMEIYGEEEEWENRLLKSGGHTLYVPDAWLWHRRTPEQLGHGYLMQRSYRAGYTQLPYRLSVGSHVTFASEMTRVVRGVGHAFRFRCFYGLLRASRHWGATRRLWDLRKSRRDGDLTAVPAAK